MKKVLLILTIFLLAIPAIAETDPKNSTSKEQPSMEAQSSHSPGWAKFGNAIKEWLKDTDGNLGVNYNYTYNGKNNHNIDVSIETRLIPKIYMNKYGGSSLSNENYPYFMYFLPFEIRVRAKGAGGWEKDPAVVKDLKAGLARFVFNPEGFTLQIASFVMKNFDNRNGRFLGVEAAGLTYNTALALVGDGRLDLVIKGRVGLGGGDLSLRQNSRYKDATDEMRPLIDTDVDRRWDRWGTFYVESGGSIGLRIAKRVLAEFFGGVNYYKSAYLAKSTTSLGYSQYIGGSNGTEYTNPYFGGSLRVMATSWLHFVAQVKRSYHGLAINFNSGDFSGPRIWPGPRSAGTRWGWSRWPWRTFLRGSSRGDTRRANGSQRSRRSSASRSSSLQANSNASSEIPLSLSFLRTYSAMRSLSALRSARMARRSAAHSRMTSPRASSPSLLAMRWASPDRSSSARTS